MNIDMLKKKISEKGISQDELAAAIGINRSTLYRKLKNGEDFSIKEATKIATELELTSSEAAEIFFSSDVA